MNIKDTIKVINQMQADGVIETYAVGGAVGATFYLEPTATFDVDVFVALKQAPDSFLVTLEPIYKYLKDNGAVEEKEYLVIEGTPVQFLPPGTPLVEEALIAAVQQEIDDVPVRVFTPEHLAAIALQLGRAKDKTRVAQFVEEGALDMVSFEQIIQRHGLQERWNHIKEAFLGQ